MASLCGRVILKASRTAIQYNSTRCLSKSLPDALELATGLEKRELLAIQAGNDDPFHMKAVKRCASTKDSPNLVASAFDSRLIGCICEEDATSVAWMWVHEGAPRRCACGHWFKLVKKPPV